MEGMTEIVFGISPEILKQLKEDKKAPEFIQEKFAYCKEDAKFYELLIRGIIATISLRHGFSVENEAVFKNGLGCWVTVYNHSIGVFGAVENFQMPYEAIVRVYKLFPRFSYEKKFSTDSTIAEIIRLLKNAVEKA